MVRKALVGLALLSAVALTACEQQQANDKICMHPPATIPKGDWKACVHQWSYRLAGSADPAKVVAEAVVNGCNTTVSDAADQRTDIPKEEQAKMYSVMRDFAEQDALFHVVQARAGRCEIPS